MRIHVLAAALKEGYSVDQVNELTKIDKWFLYRMKNIIDYTNMLKNYRSQAEGQVSVTTVICNVIVDGCHLT